MKYVHEFVKSSFAGKDKKKLESFRRESQLLRQSARACEGDGCPEAGLVLIVGD